MNIAALGLWEVHKICTFNSLVDSLAFQTELQCEWWYRSREGVCVCVELWWLKQNDILINYNFEGLACEYLHFRGRYSTFYSLCLFEKYFAEFLVNQSSFILNFSMHTCHAGVSELWRWIMARSQTFDLLIWPSCQNWKSITCVRERDTTRSQKAFVVIVEIITKSGELYSQRRSIHQRVQEDVSCKREEIPSKCSWDIALCRRSIKTQTLDLKCIMKHLFNPQ